MNRHEAKQLAETVTLSELKQMFNTATEKIENWTIPSRPNKGMSIGTAYNIFTEGFENYNSEKDIHVLAKINMIWTFGEYLPGYAKKIKKEKHDIIPYHQEPKFVEL